MRIVFDQIDLPVPAHHKQDGGIILVGWTDAEAGIRKVLTGEQTQKLIPKERLKRSILVTAVLAVGMEIRQRIKVKVVN